MIIQALLCVVAFACNCLLVAGTIHSSLMKSDPGTTLDLYKSIDRGAVSSDYDYAIVKRGPQDVQESPDSKERRSQMGSSFIRFGRGRSDENNPDNVDYSSMIGETSGNEVDSRMARGRSDVIIRFGRNDFNNARSGVSSQSRQFARSDLPNFNERENAERHGKSTGRTNYENDRDVNFDRVRIVCTNLIAGGNDVGSNDRANYYLAGKLLRLCKTLGIGRDNADEKARGFPRSKIMDVIEEALAQSDIKQK